MPTKRFSASALISAPSQDLYGIIADYRQWHPKILPTPPFVDLVVEKGGVGAGTEFLSRMKVLGQIQTFRGVVTEPEPGRVLMETTDTGYITTFTVDPRDNGTQAYVTITTEMTGRSGPLGAIERWLVSRMLQPVYVRELDKLAAVAPTYRV